MKNVWYDILKYMNNWMIYLELYVESFSEQTQIKLLFSLNFTVQGICANEYMPVR